ncbi:MAG: tetratricopeptide repeat protein, partial [Colwellia sp.]
RLLLAEIYMMESDLDKALEHIAFVLELAPNAPNVNLLYAFALLKQNKKVDALKISKNVSSYLSKIEEGDLNKHPSIRLILGTSLYLQESWESAYSHLNFYAQKYPGHEQSHLMVAELDMRFERYGAALKVLEHYSGEATSIEYWLFKVGALAKLKEYFSALIQVDQALDLFINDPRLLEYKVKLLIATNNLPDALSLLEQLHQQGNASEPLTFLLGQLQLDAAQLTSAETIVNELLEKEANNPIYLSLSAGVDLQSGRLDSAESKLKKAMKLSPKMLQLPINLHYVYLRQGKIGLAVNMLNEAYKNNPSSTFLIKKLALLAERVHNYSIAIDWRQKLVKISPDDIQNIILLSDNLIKLNRSQEAVDLLLPERINNRLNVQYLFKLSSAYISLKQCNKAGSVLDILRGLSLGNEIQLASIAQRYMQCGFNESAHKSLASAERLDQTKTQVQLARAQWFLNINQAKLALKLMKPAVDKGDMTALTLQINAYKKLNSHDTVITLSKELYKKYPYPVHAYRLFETLKNNGKLAEATDLLEKYLQQHENKNIRRTLAINYISSGNTVKAESHFLVLAEQFKDAMAYRQLAILASKNNIEQALILARKSYEIDHSSSAIAATYGWLLVQNGKPKAGLSHLRFAHARNSRQPTLIYRLAETLIQLNQYEQAKSLLKQAIKYDFPDKDKAVISLKSL